MDKSHTNAQLDSLGYTMAILTAKIPAESFSSTSGVKSISEKKEGLEKFEKYDGISPLDTLKEIADSREELN